MGQRKRNFYHRYCCSYWVARKMHRVSILGSYSPAESLTASYRCTVADVDAVLGHCRDLVVVVICRDATVHVVAAVCGLGRVTLAFAGHAIYHCSNQVCRIFSLHRHHTINLAAKEKRKESVVRIFQIECLK